MDITNLTTEQIKELSNISCPYSYGFEGPETFPDCGICIICLCKKKLDICNELVDIE